MTITKEIKKRVSKKPDVSDEPLTMDTSSTHTTRAHRRAVHIDISSVARMALHACMFLLPVWYMPFSVATLSASKLYLVYFVGILVSVLIGAHWLRTPKKTVHMQLMGLFTILVPALYIVSGFFSSNMNISFFGRDVMPDTVVSIVCFFALLGATALLFKEKTQAFYAYTALVLAGGVALLAQAFNLLVPAFPTLGIFGTSIANTVGTWHEFGFFAACVLMVSLLACIYIRVSRVVSVLLYGIAALALALIIVVNLTLLWWMLGVFSLAVLGISLAKHSQKRAMPFTVLALLMTFVFLCSTVFLLLGNVFAPSISNALRIQNLEIRPSFETTINIAQQSLSGVQTFVGVGPALFEQQWVRFRPVEVLQSDFWNVDFRYGFSLLLTLITTAGLLVSVAWLLFLVALIVLSVRSLRHVVTDPHDTFLLMTGMLLTWFLWAVMLLYVPTTVLITLTFISTGLFIATATRLELLTSKPVHLSKELWNTVYTVGVSVGMLIVILVGVKMAAKGIAHVYYQRSIYTFAQTQDVATIERFVARAITLDPIDTYLRSGAEIESMKLQALIAQANAGETIAPDAFGQIAKNIIDLYQQAIVYDTQAYRNYTTLAQFYSNLTSLGTEGAYDAAKALYSKALELKPENPEIFLQIAQLEAANKNILGARAGIEKALALKPNLSDAVYALVQLELQQGNTARAIAILEQIKKGTPNDPYIYFQLGLLKYDAGQIDGAIVELERTIALYPEFQNAKYFLGLSYYKAGQVQSAIRQFEELQERNLDNTDLQQILNNLQNGNPPIAETQPLEEVEALPLDDTAGTETDEVKIVE